ncbi:unnamed protein product [Pleuronectes platessa]|uniref:Uncharacterized protein n=1 Tax=Pleuronectes platessa TaxID=8262 RepID=A0A9N7ZAA1_PLEPL|nr:unnamed protein product [Pleuronectes platessa]
MLKGQGVQAQRQVGGSHKEEEAEKQREQHTLPAAGCSGLYRATALKRTQGQSINMTQMEAGSPAGLAHHGDTVAGESGDGGTRRGGGSLKGRSLGVDCDRQHGSLGDWCWAYGHRALKGSVDKGGTVEGVEGQLQRKHPTPPSPANKKSGYTGGAWQMAEKLKRRVLSVQGGCHRVRVAVPCHPVLRPGSTITLQQTHLQPAATAGERLAQEQAEQPAYNNVQSCANSVSPKEPPRADDRCKRGNPGSVPGKNTAKESSQDEEGTGVNHTIKTRRQRGRRAEEGPAVVITKRAEAVLSR